MKTLAIESTCDDTSLAIVSMKEGRFVVECMVTDTQGMHTQYGGVVPELASRAHAESISDVYARLVEQHEWDIQDIHSISVAGSPGLPGSLVVGITAAYTLGAALDLPVLECHHIMWHVFSVLLDRERDMLQLPYMCLTVSGGHSDIYMVDDGWVMIDDAQQDELHIKRWHMGMWETYTVWPYIITKLVQTLDDAVGEAFDKVAKMLWGPYPGWPRIQQIAEDGWPHELIATRLRPLHTSDHFSFSGVKAQVHSLLEYLDRNNILVDDQMRADIAWRFQEIVTDALVAHMTKALDTKKAKTLWVVGGVSANSILRQKMSQLASDTDIPLYYPMSFAYCTDNAAMIGVVGLLGGE